MDFSKLNLNGNEYNVKDETARNNIETINNKLADIENQKFIFIGDSFIEMFMDDNWALGLIEKLGLTTEQYYIFKEGGAGIFNPGNANTNFLGLLQSKISEISDPSEITHIIVCGGTNDVNAQNKSQVEACVKNFCDYCKETFPNAKTYIGCIGYFREHSAYESRKNINNRVLPAYCNCGLYGGIYLNDVEYVMRNYDYYTDTVHPTSEGSKQLASAIYQSLLTGHVDYGTLTQAVSFITTDDVSNASLSLYDVIQNGIHTINLNGNLTVAKTYGTSSGINIDCGDLGLKYIRKSDPNITCMKKTRIRAYANGNYYLDVNLKINEDGHLIINIPMGQLTNSIDITSIIFEETFNIPWLMW